MKNLSVTIKNIYNDIDCNICERTSCGSCLNSIRQSLEYICLFTCDYYNIPLTRKTKKGNVVDNDNPTLGDMTPLIEKYFKKNNVLWSKEIGTHIGSVWTFGNLGSHAQKSSLINNAKINKVTIANALNSMCVVTEWFFNHYGLPSPLDEHLDTSNSNISNHEKEQNKEFNEKTNELFTKLANLQLKYQNIETEYFNEANKAFDDIYFDDLIEAIESGQCVLFIGQDLSVDDNNISLHEKFFKRISRRRIEYNQKDGLFMPKSEKQIELKALNYYNKKFNDDNKIGNNILNKIAQIPFSLIISVTPDNTIHQIFDKYNKKHSYFYYNKGTKHNVEEPTKEDPVIYNMLGDTGFDGKYIFTHKQFYEYINQKQEVKIPFEIENKIKDVAHYLFLGFDFNKWQNRLLLFSLNLYNEADAYTFDADKIEDINQEFINQQFNITFIKNNYNDFVNVLLQKCEKEKLNKPLIETFITNINEDITKVIAKTENFNNLADLIKIEKKIDAIC